jgi:hypothetical protein
MLVDPNIAESGVKHQKFKFKILSDESIFERSI